MRIIHVAGDSKWGGGGGIILDLAAMAAEHGWTVDFLSTDPVCQQQARRHGLGVVDLDVIWRDIRPWRDLKGLLRLYRFFRRSDYAIVHTHTSKAGFVGRIAARLAGVPGVMHTAHAFSFHEESGFLERKIYVALEKFAALFCDCIVTVSNYHRQWAIKLKLARFSKLIAIPNGLPEVRVQPDRPASEVREELGLAGDQRMILVAGRLAAGKGLEFLIDAVSLIGSAARASFRVILAGEGPLRRTLEDDVARRGLQEVILFAGFCENVANLLNASDMVVMPSLHEGLSMTLLESMAAGKPIVASSIGSNLEATRNGEGALVVPPKDSNALASAILQFLSDPAEAERKAARARAIYLDSYTVDRMKQSYGEVYHRLAAKNLESRRTQASSAPQEDMG